MKIGNLKEAWEQNLQESKNKPLWQKTLVAVGILLAIVAAVGLLSPDSERNFEEGKQAGISVAQASPTAVSPSPAADSKQKLLEDLQEIIDYNQKLEKILTENGQLSTDIGRLLGKWPNLTDQEIIKFVSLTIAAEGSHKALEEITPPQGLTNIHNKYVKSYKTFGGAMPTLRSGLYNDDPELISLATGKIGEATDLLNEAAEDLNTFTKSLEN